MDPVKQFHSALWCFKKFAYELVDKDDKIYGFQGKPFKKFKNLAEFNAYWETATGSQYQKKTKVIYKKTNIPEKITVDRKQDPKAWDKQYHWFRIHPEAEVYDPEPRGRKND